MKVCALLVLCGLVSLGQLGAAHNVQRRSPTPTEGRAVRVQIEVDTPEPWSLSEGDSVQIRCSLSPDSDQEAAKQLNLHLQQMNEGSIGIIKTAPASKGISYTLGPVALIDRGLYSCVAEKTNPHVTVEDAHKLIWVNDSFTGVSLKLLGVNRVNYYVDQTLTIGCHLPNDGSEWRIMSASERTGSISLCPNQKRSGNLQSCNIPSLPIFNPELRSHDVFWCESSSARKTNLLNVSDAEFTSMTSRDFILATSDVTPGWFVREGDSLTIQCDVRLDKKNNRDKFDLQLLWNKMGTENNITVLQSQRASKPINYILNNITHEHSGVYSCWDDGTLSHVFVSPRHNFIWVKDDSPPVTINVLSHNRTQFFYKEEMTVGCQVPNDQSQWKLKRFETFTGVIKDCETSHLSSSGLLSCNVTVDFPAEHCRFWCESTTGLRSNVLNISNSVGNDILEAPTLPVTEGEDFTLRCIQKDKTSGEITTGMAFFNHNSRTLGSSNDGSITLRNVTKKAEGIYSCQLKDGLTTLQSYVTVKARP